MMITKWNPEMANAQHPVTKTKVPSAMINDQWYAMEWSELLSQLDFGMKVQWNQWTDEMLLRIISTLLCTQTFHLLFDCLIHHTAMWLSVQQNTFLICTTNLTALITETTSFDNKTQAKSSKRGILRSFIGATLHFSDHKFTSTPWLQTTYT